MTLRRCDRYLLREMVGPFVLALVGLLLFLLLNIVLSLTPLMVDRGIGMSTLLRLVILQLPKLFVLAVPMAALFATFLGLGRLMHDREIMAFESIGISLRRILMPLIAAAAVVSVFDFAINNWAAPASERAFQRTYLEVIFRQSVPRITPNAIFSGPDNLFFYVRRYDANTRTLHDVLIYDTEGDLFPSVSESETQVTLITAETGEWTEDTWELEGGRTYGFDAAGKLVYSGGFGQLSIPVDQSVEQILSQSRSPDEMGISELLARVEQSSKTGQRVEPYILEIHHKIALPLATIVFVLLGGTLSFTFGTRGRAVGIIASLLLISVFTGLLWWTQAIGQRGAMHPALAAWLPNLLFGGLGLLLFLRVDRLASRDLLKRLRRFVPFLALLGLLALAGSADEIPLYINADELFISSDRTEVRAEGTVEATFEDVSLSANALRLHQAPDGQWLFEATGDVRLAIEDEISLSGDQLAAVIEVTQTGTLTRSLEAGQFSGENPFVNSAGEDHTLYFRGEFVQITFDDTGEASLIEARQGEVTTCDCCGLPFRAQPYTLRAARLQLYPDRLLVVYGLTARVAGVSTFWLPVYVQPLEETLESPLFPAIGQSGLRGWFLKWNVPFYLSERLYGSVLFDYYHKFRELGTGLVLRYAFPKHEGSIDAYYFPAKVGDQIVRLSLDHSLDIGASWRGSGKLDYEARGDDESLSFAASASGRLNDWRLAVSAVRSWEEADVDEEQGDVVTERLPEFSLSREPLRIGPASLTPRLSAGWVREWEGGTPIGQAFRLDGGASAGLDPFEAAGFSVAPSVTGSFTRYAGDAVDLTRSALTVSIPATQDGLTLEYDGSFTTAESPFEFDRIEAEQHIGWQVLRPGPTSLRMESGFDLIAATLDPLSVTLSWGDEVSWALSLSYDLTAALLEAVILRGDWSVEGLGASWKIPYDPVLARFDPIHVELKAKENRTTVAVQAALENGALASLSGTVETRTTTDWGISLSATYEADKTPHVANPRYRLFQDIGDCIQVGIERASDQIWLYASILAFPEAILRYGAESASLQVGE
jgi:lipopolysaccharide export system permease protein